MDVKKLCGLVKEVCQFTILDYEVTDLSKKVSNLTDSEILNLLVDLRYQKITKESFINWLHYCGPLPKSQ